MEKQIVCRLKDGTYEDTFENLKQLQRNAYHWSDIEECLYENYDNDTFHEFIDYFDEIMDRCGYEYFEKPEGENE